MSFHHHRNQGEQVNRTEHTAKTPFSRTAIAARVVDLLHAKGSGASAPGRFRLIFLAAIAAAFLLAPATQAAAAGTLKVNIEGTGSGEVSSVGGIEGEAEVEPMIESSGPGAGMGSAVGLGC